MKGYFGKFGGKFVPEMLMKALDELEKAYCEAKNDKSFQTEFDHILKNYVGRPSPLYFAKNLTDHCGGAKIYLKLESHNHTGAHKINNAVGQALLAKKLGKKVLIAETGAGQHGVATATVAAKFGLKCKIFMGEVDIKRQYPNVYSMKLLGAEVVAVKDGTKTLKDAVNAALKYWIEHLDDTHYLIGSALGPHPYPEIVRDFQAIIGQEVKQSVLEHEKRLPNLLVACVGGGSNAIGLFYPFLNDKSVEMVGVEAGGKGNKIGEHASRIAMANNNAPSVGIVQGYKSFFIQDEYGMLQPTHSISAGLDYAGIGPEHAWLFEEKRASYVSATNTEALEAFKITASKEGIIAALESSHAIAYSLKRACKMDKNDIMVVNVSGRGDKDIFITANCTDHDNWINFLKNEVNNEQQN